VKSVTDDGIVLSTAQGDLSLQFDEIAKAVLDIQFSRNGLVLLLNGFDYCINTKLAIVAGRKHTIN